MSRPLIQIDDIVREMTMAEHDDFLSRQLINQTRDAILADLAAIDMRSIRALREGNAARIAELEAQAVALRAELAAL